MTPDDVDIASPEFDPWQRATSTDTAFSKASIWTAFSDDDATQMTATPLANMPALRTWDQVSQPKVLKEHYRMKQHLGTGRFASVLVGQHRETKEKRAIKILPISKLKTDGLIDIEQETSMAGKVQHPYIVYLYESFQDEENMYLVMELCKGGDLYSYVQSWPHDPARNGLPMDMVGKYIWQMVAGIAYLHHHHIVHRAISCENYLLKSRKRGSPLKLLDFGFACTVEPGRYLRQMVGNPLYMAPEVQQGAYNEKCDLYGIGVCSFFMCTSNFPYGNEKMSNDEILAQAAAGKFAWEAKVWSQAPDELKSIVKRLLSLVPKERPSAKQLIAVQDSWLRKVGEDPNATVLLDSERTQKAGCCVIC
eukprot:gnl/TRDRNA2_/TRDRNA2_157855_c0_seq1.p1 gnl/TRDRNA2_/TRDRNA2_157855_c0~~gnl/TRDRNA2_/TRDRNA2_157855_c0_seq1.p1  ORF type:complete len:364 (-),score=49.73 gnl/TRDRNA2_/TRDRNA2_157855_c0_seq1:7-1098(-)